MMRYIRLHRIFVAQYLKRLMEYKVDFLLGAIGLLITQAIQILFSFGLQIFWLLTMYGVTKLIWRSAVKHLAIQGG